MRSRTFQRLALWSSLVVLLQMGACIEAAPFSGEDAETPDDVSSPNDSEQDSSATDASVVDLNEQDSSTPPDDVSEDSGELQDTESNEDAPDGSHEDSTGPCEGPGCPCSNDQKCDGPLTCYEGSCCKSLCSAEMNCGSNGCGGDCGDCEKGLTCSEEQICSLKCEPNTSVCGFGDDANLVKVCNQDGNGYDSSVLPTNCLNSGESCLDGECQCLPQCNPNSCTDDGESDGCGGLCPESCGEDQICGSNGACAAEECPTGEVFCHEDDKPYLCEDGTLEGSLEGGPVVDCEGAVCLLQDFGDSEGIDLLDDFDLYCACSETQHCVSDEYLHFCDTDTGKSALLECTGGKVCDVALSACVTPDGPGDAECCVGMCGLVDECGGNCTCGGGETCADDGKCYTFCNDFDLEKSDCAQGSDKVILICEAGTPPGLSEPQYWTPYWCEVEEQNANSVCTQANALANAQCTNPAQPGQDSNECCAEHFGQCGFIEACEGVCSCQNPDVYPDGFSCSNSGTCTAPCPESEIGHRTCIDDSALMQCTQNGWVLIGCQDGKECSDDDGVTAAKCVDTEVASDDVLACSLNTGEVMSPGMPVGGEHGTVEDHESFSLNGDAGDEAFSLSMWVWGANLNVNGIQPLIRKGGQTTETANGQTTSEWTLFVKDQRLYWIVYDASNIAWYKRSEPIGNIMNGQWSHLVLTYLGNNQGSSNPHQETRFFLNGDDVTDISGQGSGQSSASVWGYMASNGGPKELQVGYSPLPEETWFNGAIDDVAIIRAYVPANVLPSMTIGNTQCGVNLEQTAVQNELAAFWRFEDLGNGATESQSLVGDHVMEFNYAPEPWDSPCSLVP